MCPISGSSPNKIYTREVATFTGADAFQQAQAAGRKILSLDQDDEGNDVAEGINAALFKNGDNFSADIPTSGFKFTGVGNAAARNQFASAGQVADSALVYAGTSAGTDIITATLVPAITAYVAGQIVALKAGGTNTGAATINVNSVGAKTIKKGKAGSLDLSAGDIAAGKMVLGLYDGTNFQLIGAPEFPSGTVMLFVQTSAPTGWTKGTTHNDKALRIVSGLVSTGGSVAFTTAFASQTPTGTNTGTAITEAQMPLHGHPFRNDPTTSAAGDPTGGFLISNNADSNRGAFTGTPSAIDGQQIGGTGGGQTHTHSFTGNAINLAVSYVDVIMATKD